MNKDNTNCWESPNEAQLNKIKFIMNKTGLDYHSVWSVLWWEYDMYVKEIERSLNGSI
jgi:hypothetical protein